MTDTKTRILEAAERLILQKGSEAVTFREITDEAGVNIASINYHFGSKKEMENALLARFIEPIEKRRLQMLEQAEAEAGTGGPSLETVVRCYAVPFMEFSRSHPNQQHVFVALNRLFNDETRFRGQVQKSLTRSLQRFSDALVRALPEVPRETVILRQTYMWFATTALLHKWLVEFAVDTLGIDVSDQALLEEMIRFLCAGFQGNAPGAPG